MIKQAWLLLLYYTIEDEKGGADMKNEITRKEAARVMKISVPTLRKYLELHAEVIVENKVNMEKLDGVITEESMKTLQKKGK
jgi:hypothetical protein